MANRRLCRSLPSRRFCLWCLATFVVAQIGLNVWIEFYRCDLRSPHVARVLDEATRAPRRPTVLVLGTSRSALAYPTNELEPRLKQATGDPGATAFNASIPLGDYATMSYVTRELFRKNLRPTLVVIETAPEMLHRRNPGLGRHVMPPIDRETIGKYPAELWLVRGRIPEIVKERLVPIHENRRALCKEIGHWFETAVETPTAEKDDSPPAAVAAERAPRTALFLDGDVHQDPIAAARAKLPRVQQALSDYSTDGMATLILDRLIRRCREQGSAVLLVAPPLLSVTRGGYEPEVESLYLARLDEMRAVHHFGYADLRTAVADEDFYDSCHVVVHGAQVASGRLADAVQRTLRGDDEPRESIDSDHADRRQSPDRDAGRGRADVAQVGTLIDLTRR